MSTANNRTKLYGIHQFNEINEYSVETGITATAGGGQVNAYELTATYNEVTTVASNADSVQLTNTGSIGTVQFVKNRGSSLLTVYPPVGEQIGNEVTNAGVDLYGENTGLYYEGEVFAFHKVSDTQWLHHAFTYLNTLQQLLYQAPTNFIRDVQFGGRIIQYGYFHMTATTSLTAYAGGGQANATTLGPGFTNITTCASNGDSVILPVGAGSAGVTVLVFNGGSSTCAIFPPSGGTINGGSTNASVNLESGRMAIFTVREAGGVNWAGGKFTF